MVPPSFLRISGCAADGDGKASAVAVVGWAAGPEPDWPLAEVARPTAIKLIVMAISSDFTGALLEGSMKTL
jgi:hypothetical protein